MKREYPPLTALKKEFGKNKIIPIQYEEPILRALSHYPELKDSKIEFRLSDEHPLPYETSPSSTALITHPSKRKYIVTLLEKADPPMEGALFKNLPQEAQLGVIAHELGHVVRFSGQNFRGLLKTSLNYLSSEQAREAGRNADVCAIEHGLGFELYTHARYIRTIPGYTDHRKEIDINYLHPNEILESLGPDTGK